MKKVICLLIFVSILLTCCSYEGTIQSSSDVSKTELPESNIEQTESSIFNTSVSEDPFVEVTSKTESFDESSSSFTKSYDYRDFNSQYSKLAGRWFVKNFCTSAKYVNDDFEYVFSNAINTEIEISPEGIYLWDTLHEPSGANAVLVSLYSKSEIAVFSGHIEYDKIPLSEDTKHEYIEIGLIVPEAMNGKASISVIYICVIDENSIFLGLDEVFFVAERVQ